MPQVRLMAFTTLHITRLAMLWLFRLKLVCSRNTMFFVFSPYGWMLMPRIIEFSNMLEYLGKNHRLIVCISYTISWYSKVLQFSFHVACLFFSFLVERHQCNSWKSVLRKTCWRLPILFYGPVGMKLSLSCYFVLLLLLYLYSYWWIHVLKN